MRNIGELAQEYGCQRDSKTGHVAINMFEPSPADLSGKDTGWELHMETTTNG